MKKNNLWRIIWIVGIYAILVSILYLVVLYKVKWENKDLNTYLYFYNCSNNLCTSDNEPEDYYNKVICPNDICPSITEINGDSVILSSNKESYLYNYKTDNIINNNYLNYKVSSDGNYVVMNDKNLYGVIDNAGKIIINFDYDNIVDYNNGFILYVENNKYGIDNKDNNIHIKPTYEKALLINNNYYGYFEDNKYYIANYDTELPVNDMIFDYIYPIKDHILTIKDKQIDILNDNLQSKLIMKVNTYYSYTVEKERATLNIYSKNNYIYFNVYNNNEYINYMYDINSGKLYN